MSVLEAIGFECPDDTIPTKKKATEKIHSDPELQKLRDAALKSINKKRVVLTKVVGKIDVEKNDVVW